TRWPRDWSSDVCSSDLVNTISPTAATRMTEELLPLQALALMRPEAITPAVEFLLSEDAPTRTIMGAGAGSFAVIKIIETEGINQIGRASCRERVKVSVI